MDDTPELRRATQGDRAALRELVRRWMPRIRRWALMAAGDPVVAEDGVQEALVRVWRGIGEVDPERPLGPWLKTVVTNAVRSEASRQRRRTDREAPATGHEPDLGPSLGRRMDLHRARSEAVAAFVHLSPRQREILDLVDLQGCTPADVAVQLGLSAGAVRGQLFDARRAVRAHLLENPEILQLLREP